MHTNPQGQRVWHRLSSRISKGAYLDCADSASQVGAFHSNITAKFIVREYNSGSLLYETTFYQCTLPFHGKQIRIF